MIKKVALSARSLITLIRIVMYGLYDDSRKIMGVRVISQQQADSMTAQKTLSVTSEQLFIEGCAVPYDADSERYYLSQSMDYRLWQGVLTCDSNYDIYIVRSSTWCRRLFLNIIFQDLH